MAIVIVSRQHVDENNQLTWIEVEVDEAELLPIETPIPEEAR